MRNSIRWLLTEAKLSNIDTNKINISGNKLICYHLTSKRAWLNYNEAAKRMDQADTQPDKEILPTDTKAQRIVKKITNARKNKRPEEWQIEEFVIEDMIDDPYTDTSGFTPGGGDYHGKGLYTCYKFNPKIASTYGNICLVFEIDISNFIITFEDLAKQVHGENWRIKDQLIKLYQLGERSQESIEKYKKYISEIPDSDLEMGKSIKSLSGRTANISLKLLSVLDKKHVTSLYDGIILFGTTDGPVCVSFYPKYDAKLIGLGRLNKDRPEIVDWYDSLNDFVGGRAKLKQDFETINNIAEEITDPAEKAEMKAADRPGFDMDYLDITEFFRSYNQVIRNPESAISTLFGYYEDAKSSSDSRKLEFFIEGFERSAFADNHDVANSGPKYIELINNVVKIYKQKNKSISGYFFNKVFDVCNRNNIALSDLFLSSAINRLFSDKAFAQESHLVRSFKYKIDAYLEMHSINPEIKNLIDEKYYSFGIDIVMMERDIEEVLEFYSNADETTKNKLIVRMINKFPRAGNFYWRDVTPQNFDTANELLEKLIDELNKAKPTDYEFDFIRIVFIDLPDVNYFSDKVNNFIANSFFNSLEQIKSTPNSSLFVNTIEYIREKLGNSHPVVSRIDDIENQKTETAGEDIEAFVESLKLGQVTSTNLRKKIQQFCQDLPYITYLSKQSKDWFKNFFNAVVNNVTVKNFKVLGKGQTSFLLAIIMSYDIVLTKEEQLAFTRKIGKSDYDSKNLIASYKHIDPDVFIGLIGPDLKAGGMGPGLTFKGFEYTPNVYRLLYKHRKIVDLFCDVARPGLMKMIVSNLIETLAGNPNPLHTWAQSGKLKGGSLNYTLDTLPYLGLQSEEATISEVVNMDDIAWFEYFISRAKKAPKRGVANLVAKLEKNINDKKAITQSSDDLDPQLDLSHRKVIGNSLKEVYNITARKRSH